MKKLSQSDRLEYKVDRIILDKATPDFTSWGIWCFIGILFFNILVLLITLDTPKIQLGISIITQLVKAGFWFLVICFVIDIFFSIRKRRILKRLNQKYFKKGRKK